METVLCDPGCPAPPGARSTAQISTVPHGARGDRVGGRVAIGRLLLIETLARHEPLDTGHDGGRAPADAPAPRVCEISPHGSPHDIVGRVPRPARRARGHAISQAIAAGRVGRAIPSRNDKRRSGEPGRSWPATDWPSPMRKSTAKPRRKKAPKRVLALPDLEQSKAAVLNSLTSASGQRTYDHAIREFVAWYCSEPRLAFNRTVVLRYRIHLEQRHYAPATINLRLAAVRRVAYEAADAGLLSPELAAGIRRVKGVRRLGVRLGNWLTPEQGRRLLTRRTLTTPRQLRDHAMLAVLLGCGLRRGELLALQLGWIQQREEHWVIADLVGKGGHVRTVPMPAWVKDAIDAWTTAANITEGTVFRAISKLGRVWGNGMTAKVLWDVVRHAAAEAGIAKLAPHDLRRTCARLCHLAGGSPTARRSRPERLTILDPAAAPDGQPLMML